MSGRIIGPNTVKSGLGTQTVLQMMNRDGQNRTDTRSLKAFLMDHNF
jgi:hypothetical protein